MEALHKTCHVLTQDILRLLTLWFNHGASTDVQAALQEGFKQVTVETWLAVLPQIIARIHSTTPAVRNLVQSLLITIGRGHPQVPWLPPALKILRPSRGQGRSPDQLSVIMTV